MGVLRVIAAFAFAALLAACDSPRELLQAHDLKVAAQQLQSIAQEGSWLARELQDGSVTRNMAWVHQQALGEDTVKALSDLAKPVPQEMREQHAQVLDIAAKLQAQVGRIAPAATQPEELQSVRRDLDALVHAAEPLAKET